MNQYTSRGAGRVNAAFKVGGGYEWLCSGDNRVVVIRTLGTANYYTSLGRHWGEKRTSVRDVPVCRRRLLHLDEPRWWR